MSATVKAHNPASVWVVPELFRHIYSHAAEVCDVSRFLFISGQFGVPATGTTPASAARGRQNRLVTPGVSGPAPALPPTGAVAASLAAVPAATAVVPGRHIGFIPSRHRPALRSLSGLTKVVRHDLRPGITKAANPYRVRGLEGIQAGWP